MHGMQHRLANESTIDEPPYLDVVEARIGVHSRRVEFFTVDHPLNAGGTPMVGRPPNTNVRIQTACGGCSDSTSASRSGTLLSSLSADDVETHDGPALRRARCSQDDLLPIGQREKSMTTSTRSAIASPILERHRRGKQPLVGGDLKERLMGAERQPHRHRVRGVHDAKPVFPRGDVEHRPGGAVDQHDPADGAMMALMVVLQFAIAVNARSCSISGMS